MEIVEIVADRFGVARDRRAIDLATGALVTLKIGVGGGATEQARWSNRCDGLHSVRHPRVATLVDYGALGESQRFEAWQCSAIWSGTAEEAGRTVRATSQYLHASGLTNGDGTAVDLRECEGRPVILPGNDTGYLAESAASTEHSITARVAKAPETIAVDNCGICTIDRRADATFADLFASLDGSRPHIISMWGPPGSGRTTAALRAARMARLNGFVPIALRILSQIDVALIKGRHLCLIDDDNDAGVTRWGTLLSAALASPRVHVLLRIGRDEFPGVHGVGLDRVPPDRLAGAVRPARLADCTVRQVVRAAVLARSPGSVRPPPVAGWRRPDRQHASVLSRSPVACRGTTVRVQRPAARRAHVAGARRVGRLASSIRSGDRTTEEGPTRAWPAPVTPGDRRALTSRRLGSRQRRIAGVGVCAARSRRRRATLTVLDEAKACGERMRSDAFLIDVAVLSGHAWMDLARPDDAESVIGTALAVAHRIGDGSRRLSASLALGRCLFWKGQYADARSALALPAAHGVGPHLTVPIMAAAARAAVGMRDVSGAMALAPGSDGRSGPSRRSCTRGARVLCCRVRAPHDRRRGCGRCRRSDLHRSRPCSPRSDARDSSPAAIGRKRSTTRPRLVVGVVHQTRTGHGLDASTTNHPGEGGPGSSVDGNASVAGRHGRAARWPVRAGGAVAVCREDEP